MSDSVDALLFLGAISAVMTWFSTTIASALSQLVFRILAGAVLSAVLSVSVLSLIAVLVVIPMALAVLVALAVSVALVAMAAA